MINELNMKAKDLCTVFSFSRATAKKRYAEIRKLFNIRTPQTVSYYQVASYFGQEPQHLLNLIRELKR